ncbi:MAG: DUF2817 domain-containing protein [Actinobacteria bacterium]|uniref:Unannotated protein n=1 Tax=freshwater metagenome TaxID=449393 RepID=A0A6J6QN91_9ZZZZ|nr:DUF2817 domain-containing protein [Actinomycetota bacterium]
MKKLQTLTIRSALVFGVGLGVILGFCGPLASLPRSTEVGVSEVIGTSGQGRAIVATRYGSKLANTRVVVVGQMHGNERAGRRVTSEIARRLGSGNELPADSAIWLISSINPDGAAANTRATASGVDLNRNFPAAWLQQGRGGSRWSGPSAGSEPESEAVMAFLERTDPTALLSFHQPFAVVDLTHPASRPAGRRLANWLGLPAEVVGCPGPCHGTMTGWVDGKLGAIALTVELPKLVTSERVARSATAVLRLTKWLAR